MAEERVLLAVLAHPDDESFGMGGTLALYAQRGVAVHLVCATRGEAGEMAPEMLEGYASTAERRVSELRCAAGILGLSGVDFLDYRDSGMTGSPDNEHPEALVRAPLEEVTGRIVTHIRRLRPQVVVTFDPIGGYKHPDHIAVHLATVQAFQQAGDPNYVDPQGLPAYQPQKLYYHVISKRMLQIAVRVMPLLGRDPRRFGRNGDIDLLDLANAGNFPIHAVIDYRAVAEKRAAAAACHASQLEGGPQRGLLGLAFRLFGGKEAYMRAAPPVKGRGKERDLFEGINLSFDR